MKNKRGKGRKEWQQQNYKLRKNHHLHHIVPIHMGGLDMAGNLEELTIKQHAKKHLQLYNKYKKQEDLAAYKFLNGLNEEGFWEICSMAGKMGGKLTVLNKSGIHGLSKSKKRKIASKGGKATQKTLKLKQLTSFYNPILREAALKRAKQIQEETKTNPITHATREQQSLWGKRGGPKNKGFIWLNNGITELKYTRKQQKIESVCKFLKNNPQYSKGRLINPLKDTIAFSNSKGNRKYFNPKKYESIEQFLIINEGYKRGYK